MYKKVYQTQKNSKLEINLWCWVVLWEDCVLMLMIEGNLRLKALSSLMYLARRLKLNFSLVFVSEYSQEGEAELKVKLRIWRGGGDRRK